VPQSGRVEGLERLVADRGEQLLRTAVLLAGSREAGEDLLQEGLVRLLRHLPQITGDPEGYLRRRLYSLAVDGWRRQRTWHERLRALQAAAISDAADSGAMVRLRSDGARHRWSQCGKPERDAGHLKSSGPERAREGCCGKGIGRAPRPSPTGESISSSPSSTGTAQCPRSPWRRLAARALVPGPSAPLAPTAPPSPS